MNPKTVFYIINILVYPLLIRFAIPLMVQLFDRKGSGGDVMGNAMGTAFLMFCCGVFLVVVTFVTSVIIGKIHFHSFIPSLISLIAGLVLSFVIELAPTIIKERHYKAYNYYDSGSVKQKIISKKNGWKIVYYNEDGTVEKIETRKKDVFKTKWKKK